MEWVDMIFRLIPALGSLIKALISLGHSPDEVEEIVQNDIKSLAAKYEAEKDEDARALEKKHGRTNDGDGS